MLESFHAILQRFLDWISDNINDRPHIMYPVILLAGAAFMILIYYLFKAIIQYCSSILHLCSLT